MLEAPRDTRNWSRERVLRVLLDPVFGIPGGASLYRVAKETHVAYGWTHQIWSELVDAGAFQETSAGPRLQDPQAAFRYWLQHRPPRAHADYHVLDALSFLKSIEHDADLEYAATTYLAENLTQGHLFPRRFDLYIKPEQQASWQRRLVSLGFPIDSPDPGRGTIRLIIADPLVVDEVAPMQPAPLPPNPVRGIWTVRLPLLIIDLLEEGGPCVEAAEKLMEKTYA